MIEPGSHLEFVFGAWGGVALITLALIGWVAWESLRARRRLTVLEKAGLARRSEPGT